MAALKSYRYCDRGNAPYHTTNGCDNEASFWQNEAKMINIFKVEG
jgi:hypothetical protein